ncbi:hypothetical protein PCASD_24459 [Puccinia coronata f. sp. avenae]|uniref:Uncharacterized protein n=1 Tax=Puccinia coronata f. sp. avenae TaxID=200324 RepID=A0A2N5TJ90_9BASI|nr:hypothetical protein PCASD_24459 [Puccinia coronata f. sp. avenae]
MAPNTPLFCSQSSDRPSNTPATAPANHSAPAPNDSFDIYSASWHGKRTTGTAPPSRTTILAVLEDPFGPSSEAEIPKCVPKVPNKEESDNGHKINPRLQIFMLTLLGVEGNQEAIQTQLERMTNKERIAALLGTNAAVIKRLDALTLLMAGGPGKLEVNSLL